VLLRETLFGVSETSIRSTSAPNARRWRKLLLVTLVEHVAQR
jgi:hypothetical protein